MLRYTYILFLLLFAAQLNAQTTEQQLKDTILHKDSLFWQSYNNCATEATGQFFFEDVEFYHDKGGVTLGITALAASLKNNLCANPDWRLRREAVASSVHLFPLYKGNEIYGAILSGDHKFYITEKGKKEFHSGNAKFTHLWLKKNGEWKMSRVLSYDHTAAPYQTSKTVIPVTNKTLKQYVGTYEGTQSGVIKVEADNGFLVLRIKDKSFIIYPETESRYFSKERDLDFEFIKNGRGLVEKFRVLENGKVAEEVFRK